MQRAIDEEDRLDRGAAVRIVRRTAELLRPHRPRTIAAVAVMVGSTLATLAGPLLIRMGIDRGVRARDTKALNITAVVYLGVVIVGFVFGRMQVRLVGLLGEGFLRDLRVRVFAHLERLEAPDVEVHKREPQCRLQRPARALSLFGLLSQHRARPVHQHEHFESAS